MYDYSSMKPLIIVECANYFSKFVWLSIPYNNVSFAPYYHASVHFAEQKMPRKDLFIIFVSNVHPNVLTFAINHIPTSFLVIFKPMFVNCVFSKGENFAYG